MKLAELGDSYDVGDDDFLIKDMGDTLRVEICPVNNKEGFLGFGLHLDTTSRYDKHGVQEMINNPLYDDEEFIHLDDGFLLSKETSIELIKWINNKFELDLLK